jgi:hypothetical protein
LEQCTKIYPEEYPSAHVLLLDQQEVFHILGILLELFPYMLSNIVSTIRTVLLDHYPMFH